MSSTSASDFDVQEDFVQYLTARFFNNEYCTWADLVLISINPLRELSINKNRNIALKKALKGKSLIKKLEPHIYSVVHRALCCLSVNRLDQIIVFSGDSGSGKSHAAEEALKFIADIDTPLSQICHAQTLLSCFGNAATEYHGNSSRFGNLLVLNYSEFSKTILKAKIRTYLLEKTRVSSPSIRNFHVFYQLIAACQMTGQDSLYLDTDKKFRILPGQITADDGDGFKKMLEAFAGLDFNWPLIKRIFEVISGILYLGNIVFTSIEDSSFHAEVNWEESSDDLQKACELLGLDSETLALILTNSLISFDKHERRSIQIPLTSTRDATTRRDALMKLLYLLLFNWIVSYINNKFDRGDSVTTFKLGLLDIYGFEMFSRNSLEQLCINYANERLHNYFVQDILIQKKKILKDEGMLPESELICMEEDYSRKSIARIILMDAQSSVFSVINEGSLLIHHCEGKEVCHKLENLPKNDLIKVDKHSGKFVIKHFAGNVTYNSNHMVEKNSDKVPHELINILLNSSKEFVVQLVVEDRSHTLKHTVLGKFKRSLDLLMTELKNAQVHYVRCVKPNIQMKPGLIDKQFFERQLRSSGIMEAAKLCGYCLPVRLNLDRFFYHFGCLINGKEKKNVDYDKVISFEKWANDSKIKYQIGDGENIFLEENDLIDLEKKVQFLRKRSTRVIQNTWREYRHKVYNCPLSSASIVERYSSPSQIDIGYPEKKIDHMRLILNDDIKKIECLEVIKEIIDAVITTNQSRGIQRILSPQNSEDENGEFGESKVMLKLLEDKAFLNFQDHLLALPPPSNSEEPKSESPSHYEEIDLFPCSDTREITANAHTLLQRSLMNSITRSISLKAEECSSKLTGRLGKAKDTHIGELADSSSNQYNYKLLQNIEISSKKVGTNVFFVSNTGIASRRALAKIPIWFHTKKTCIKNSHIVPFVLLPLGVQDAFE